jgi:hypothetical protein
MNEFILILIGLIICLISSLMPLVRRWLSIAFDSKQFKAIRFVLTVFGVLSLFLGLVKWYTESRRMTIHDKSNFQIFISPDIATYNNPIKDTYAMSNAISNIFHRPFCAYFHSGWRSVVTKIGLNHDENVSTFEEEKGESVSLGTLGSQTSSSMHECIAPRIDFFIPPKSTFNISFKRDKNNRLWCFIKIENNDMSLLLEITTIKTFCYTSLTYKKKGIFNYLFSNFDKYDEWYSIVKKGIDDLQDVNRSMLSR